MIQYALEIRLNATVERIKYSTMTLEEIAETCGFASYSYFHRVFRANYGVSPVKFRETATVPARPGRRRAHAKFFLLYNGVAKAPAHPLRQELGAAH